MPNAEVSSAAARRVVLIQVYEIAADHASGYREGLTRERALAELAAVCADPEVLAEAAAAHATADNWYAITAVDLLIEAGADRHRIEWYVDEYGPAGDDPSIH